jgi:hypothetical protein
MSTIDEGNSVPCSVPEVPVAKSTKMGARVTDNRSVVNKRTVTTRDTSDHVTI